MKSGGAKRVKLLIAVVVLVLPGCLTSQPVTVTQTVTESPPPISSATAQASPAANPTLVPFPWALILNETELPFGLHLPPPSEYDPQGSMAQRTNPGEIDPLRAPLPVSPPADKVWVEVFAVNAEPEHRIFLAAYHWDSASDFAKAVAAYEFPDCNFGLRSTIGTNLLRIWSEGEGHGSLDDYVWRIHGAVTDRVDGWESACPTKPPTFHLNMYNPGDQIEVSGGSPTGYYWRDFDIADERGLGVKMWFEQQTSRHAIGKERSAFPDWGEIVGDDRVNFCRTGSDPYAVAHINVFHRETGFKIGSAGYTFDDQC